MPEIKKLPMTLAGAVGIAVSAGKLMKKHFVSGDMEHHIKEDGTPVTTVDKMINRDAVSRIRDFAPDVDIVGEEFSDRKDSPWKVVIDPIDGTLPYVWRIKLSTFILALLFRNVPVMGVIYDPFADRLYGAERGTGAWLSGDKLWIPSSRVGTGQPVVGYVSKNGRKGNMFRVCELLEKAGVLTVSIPSLGYMIGLVAEGKLAATMFSGRKIDETAAGEVIIEAAGGRVTDFWGNPLIYTEDGINGHIMSSNRRVHELIVEAVHACNLK